MQIGLLDIKGPCPVMQRVPVFDTGELMCLLEDALPLRALLAPLEHYSSHLMAAIEALQPDAAGRLGFGSAMHAILDYLVRIVQYLTQ